MSATTRRKSIGDQIARPRLDEREKRRKSSEREALLPGIIGGERVLIHKPSKVPLEREVEIRIMVAISAAGHMVWKHRIEACVHCHKKPTKLTGLGEGTSDIIAIHRSTGRFVGIEVKRPGYSPSDVRPVQHKWLATVARFGGVTGIATSEEEAMAIMARAGAVTELERERTVIADRVRALAQSASSESVALLTLAADIRRGTVAQP